MNSRKPIKSAGLSKSRTSIIEELRISELKKMKILKKQRAIESEQLKSETSKVVEDSAKIELKSDDSASLPPINENVSEEPKKMDLDLSPLPEKPKVDEPFKET